MPWKRLAGWFPGRRFVRLAETQQLTLVTLSARPGASAEEVDFHSEAEFDALIDWARTGRFILALASAERDELVLLCVESVAAMEAEVRQLPLVAARLAAFDIRPVMPLRLVEVSGPTSH